MKTDGAFHITPGWAGRLALVTVLTAILLASSFFVFAFNFYNLAPSLIGYYLTA